MPKRKGKRLFALLVCLLACTLSGIAEQTPVGKKPSSGTAAVTRDYLQKIWNGWAALNPPEQAQYYAQGAHVFFDIAPLKYNSWEEYQAGVSQLLDSYKAAKFLVNDDAAIHAAGGLVWVTATVASDMTEKSGKRDMSTLRWTALFEKQQGKWLIIHEHVSAPLQ